MNLHNCMGSFDYRYCDIFRIIESIPEYRLSPNCLSTMLITGKMDQIIIKPKLIKDEQGTLMDVQFTVYIDAVKEKKDA